MPWQPFARTPGPVLLSFHSAMLVSIKHEFTVCSKFVKPRRFQSSRLKSLLFDLE